MREDDVTVPAIDSHQWQVARQATMTLRETLQRAGLERDLPYLRADLNAFGQGYVELGRVAPDTAERLAELVQRGVAFLRAESVDEEEGDPT
jgi:hypothetical protein